MVARKLERATMPKMVAVALAIFGIALVIGLFGGRKLHFDSIGVGAALVAAFSFSYYNIFAHSLLQRYDRWTVLLFTTMSAAVFWLFINSPRKIAAEHYTAAAWGFLFVFAILSVLLPFVFYFAGLQHLRPTKAIVASCLEPVFSIILAAVFLSESVTLVQIAGVVVVLAATVLIQMPDRAGKPATIEPME
jgi:drug/metabolite transporter (DMT)-like permease